MRREDWKTVEQKLSGSYGSVNLRCDGYEVILQVERLKARTYVIAVYVNGWMKGEWLLGETEESRRFYQAKTVFLYGPAARKKAVKKLGKRRAEEYGFLKSFTSRTPYWTSVTALRRHFQKHNQSIELMGPYEVVSGVYE